MNKNNLIFVGLDPLFNVAVKVFIKDIYTLQVHDNLKDYFKFYQHSIQKAEICGCVVGIEKKSATDIYTVDDGTATIECIFEHDSHLQIEPIALGDCVRVSGRINDYHGNRELRVHVLDLMGPNDELMHNFQAMLLRKEYQKTMEIPAEYRSYESEITKQLHEEEINLGLVLPSDSQEVKIDTATFCDALLKHLKTRFQKNHFSATAAMTDESLKVLAREAVKNSEFKANPTVKEIAKFFYNCLKALETEGHVIQMDPRNQLYKIVNEEHLKYTILQIIQETLDSKDNYIGGVTEEYIFAKIQNEDGYSHFPRDKVFKLLEEMVYNSVIYSCGSDEYKILK